MHIHERLRIQFVLPKIIKASKDSDLKHPVVRYHVIQHSDYQNFASFQLLQHSDLSLNVLYCQLFNVYLNKKLSS